MAIDHESPFKELRLKNRRIMVSYLAGTGRPLVPPVPLTPAPRGLCSPGAFHSSILLLASCQPKRSFLSVPVGTCAYFCAAMAAAP